MIAFCASRRPGTAGRARSPQHTSDRPIARTTAAHSRHALRTSIGSFPAYHHELLPLPRFPPGRSRLPWCPFLPPFPWMQDICSRALHARTARESSGTAPDSMRIRRAMEIGKTQEEREDKRLRKSDTNRPGCSRRRGTYAPAVAIVEKHRLLENGTNSGFRALFDLREKLLVVKWWSRRWSAGSHKKPGPLSQVRLGVLVAGAGFEPTTFRVIRRVASRLGYLSALARSILRMPFRLEAFLLSPASARTGKLDAKWRIIVNEEVDPDI